MKKMLNIFLSLTTIFTPVFEIASCNHDVSKDKTQALMPPDFHNLVYRIKINDHLCINSFVNFLNCNLDENYKNKILIYNSSVKTLLKNYFYISNPVYSHYPNYIDSCILFDITYYNNDPLNNKIITKKEEVRNVLDKEYINLLSKNLQKIINNDNNSINFSGNINQIDELIDTKLNVKDLYYKYGVVVKTIVDEVIDSSNLLNPERWVEEFNFTNAFIKKDSLMQQGYTLSEVRNKNNKILSFADLSKLPKINCYRNNIFFLNLKDSVNFNFLFYDLFINQTTKPFFLNNLIFDSVYDQYCLFLKSKPKIPSIIFTNLNIKLVASKYKFNFKVTCKNEKISYTTSSSFSLFANDLWNLAGGHCGDEGKFNIIMTGANDNSSYIRGNVEFDGINYMNC